MCQLLILEIIGALIYDFIFQTVNYVPPQPSSKWAKYLGLHRRASAPMGLYLWGTVGTGKTMLMDLFFECAPIEKKMRVRLLNIL